jgi:hypothetical protein
VNKKLVIIIPIVVIAVIVIFSFSSNTKSQNNNQLGIFSNVQVEKNTSSTPPAPKKIEISLSESVNMAAK